LKFTEKRCKKTTAIPQNFYHSWSIHEPRKM